MTTVADVNAEFLRYHAQVRPHLKGILDPGFERHEARFSAPLATWAANEGLEKLVAATAIGFTASGYGHPSDPDLPALYFLKYAETATFCMDPGTLRYWTPRGGFGNVWKRVADELPDVRCGAEIEAVERDADGVRVRVGGVTHRFNRLVVAAPLDELSNWLELSAEEAELFSKIRLLDYATVIVSAVGLPRDGFFLVKNHCEDPRSVGHAVAFHHRHPDSDVYLFWAYLEEGMTDEELLGRLGEDAARLGGRFTTVHAVHRWRYFPHVSPAAMEAGFYRRAAAMQGRQHTFYAGSLFNFELVDCNMRHARAIARAVMQEEAAAPVEAQRPAPAAASAPRDHLQRAGTRRRAGGLLAARGAGGGRRGRRGARPRRRASPARPRFAAIDPAARARVARARPGPGAHPVLRASDAARARPAPRRRDRAAAPERAAARSGGAGRGCRGLVNPAARGGNPRLSRAGHPRGPEPRDPADHARTTSSRHWGSTP